MVTSDQYRAKAAEYAELAKAASTPEAAIEFRKLERSFTTLADNEQWLSDHHDETVHASVNANSGTIASTASSPALAVEEDKILRYLGVALIMQWDTLSAGLKRELFDVAGSMGELVETASLRGEIARFLHRRKDGEISRL